jgi:hypothetical protein
MLDLQGQRADLRPKLAMAHRTAMLLIMGFAVSIGVYVAIGVLLLARITDTRPTLSPVPFYVATVFLALGSVFFRRSQMHRFRLEAVTLKRGPEGLIRHFVNVTIISAALAEAIGALGLVASLLTANSDIVIRLGIVALAIIFYNYPRLGAWQHAIDYYSATMPGAR